MPPCVCPATLRLWTRIPIRQQNPGRIASRIVILPVAQGPEEGTQAKPAQNKRNRDQPKQNIHGYFIRMALSETVTDDSDMAMADISGVAKPNSANGTAMTL